MHESADLVMELVLLSFVRGWEKPSCAGDSIVDGYELFADGV